MKRVTSIGGIFFKCNNPAIIKEWYNKHLGLNTDKYGTSFEWRHADNPDNKGYTSWSPFYDDTKYFRPSKKDFMINFRVHDLTNLLEVLKKEGVKIIGEMEVYEYGKFAHIMDPEGNKIELWEPNDKEYEKIVEGKTC